MKTLPMPLHNPALESAAAALRTTALALLLQITTLFTAPVIAADTDTTDPADIGTPLLLVAPHAQTVTDTAESLWNWAELGYLETESSGLLQETLAAAGFHIDTGVGGIPTAFTASFGNGKPVIGIMGEFDALARHLPSGRALRRITRW
jgi:aminobenzoyl-glutamate utilization protein B